MTTEASIRYYSRDKECLAILTNDGIEDRATLQKKWQYIEQREKAVRYDAKVFSKLILQLPNSWSIATAKKQLRDFLSEGPLKAQDYAVFIHEGKQGEVAQNFHCHLIYNERDKESGKKNRKMSKLGFQRDLVRSFQELYGEVEQQKIALIPKVERIPMALWKAAPDLARQQKAILRAHIQLQYESYTRDFRRRLQSVTSAFRELQRGAEGTTTVKPSSGRALEQGYRPQPGHNPTDEGSSRDNPSHGPGR